MAVAARLTELEAEVTVLALETTIMSHIKTMLSTIVRKKKSKSFI